MNNQSLSSLTIDNLKILTTNEAVEVFQHLLWAEATRCGIAVNKVRISQLIFVADGGVDATVEDVGSDHGSQLIREGLTMYQIKTGDFDAWQESKIKSELFSDVSKSLDVSNLKPAIKKGLDQGGSYVLVLFGENPPSDKITTAKSTIEKLLNGAGYTNAKVDVWDQGSLLGFFQPFPALRLKLNRRLSSDFQIYDNWSMEHEMTLPFISNEELELFIESRRLELRDDQTVHIRMKAEPGAGKTRLALETINTDDLRPLVIYFPHPDKFEQSTLLNEITLPNNPVSVIIIVDECDQEHAIVFWNRLKNCSKIKLVTIFNEIEPRISTWVDALVPIVDTDVLIKIFETYAVPRDQAVRYAGLCGSSPRVAQVLGQNFATDSADLLQITGTVDIWNRFIKGRNELAEKVEVRKKVLGYLSLFKRFGYGLHYVEETKLICGLIKTAYPSITEEVINDVIEDLKKRKILQGSSTLYLTPRALHIWLWRDWWEKHELTFNVEEFIKTLPTKLKQWFLEMFKYAAESGATNNIVKRLLADGGLFDTVKQELKDVGMPDFFLALAEADPETALVRLEKNMLSLTSEQLLELREGRREIIWSLERMAVWHELFERAANLLLSLAEAENDKIYSNNATGVFAGLFSLGQGDLAPTTTPPKDRFPILVAALKSNSKSKRLVALTALDRALDVNLSRVIGAENQGLKAKPKLWAAQTDEEILGAFRQAWEMLIVALEDFSGEEHAKAFEIIINNSYSLGRINRLSEMVLTSLSSIANKVNIDKNKIIKVVLHVLCYGKEELDVETFKKWEIFKSELIGTDFSSQLHRYVGLNAWDDPFDRIGGGKIDESEKAENKIKLLAKEAVVNNEELEKELVWLQSAEANNGYAFGYALGQADEGFTLLDSIETSYLKNPIEKRSLFFMGGYLRVVYEKDKERLHSELDKISKDEVWLSALPELTWRSGTDDVSMNRILQLIKEKSLEAKCLGYFIYGGIINNLSEQVFEQVMNTLIETGLSNEASIALSLFNYYYVFGTDKKMTIPQKLTLELLTLPQLFGDESTVSRNNMPEYHWAQIAKEYIEVYPNDAIAIARILIQHAGERNIIGAFRDKETQEVLNKITELNPEQVWEAVFENMDDKGFHYFKEWLGGGTLWNDLGYANKILKTFPFDRLWKWIDEDVEARAWYIASMVPKKLFDDEDGKSIARELLIRYGDRKDVQRNLMANFNSEGWTGSQTVHFQRKKQIFEGYLEKETEPMVKNWLKEYIQQTADRIESARIEQERDDFFVS